MNVVTPAPTNNDLFQLTLPRKLHSGQESFWKIECDALTDEELEWFAKAISIIVEPFGYVEYVPTGAKRIAEKMERYIQSGHPTVLIVDDVLTTGNSMENFRKDVQTRYPDVTIIGATMFNRSLSTFGWIKSVMHVNHLVLEKLP